MDLKEAKITLSRIPPPSFGLMRISEAAAFAGVCAETLRRRVRRGELPAWGRPRRVALNDVLQQFEPGSAQRSSK